jgi:hypothetical protein
LQPTQELLDSIFRDRVLHARKIPPEERMAQAAELFDYACAISRSGIRHQFPDADEQRVEEILKERFALVRKLDDAS